MTDDDDDFVLDASGNLVSVGLTLDETIEFKILDNSIAANGATLPHISRDEWHRPEEKRWLELWDKHQTAKGTLRQNEQDTSLSASEIYRRPRCRAMFRRPFQNASGSAAAHRQLGNYSSFERRNWACKRSTTAVRASAAAARSARPNLTPMMSQFASCRE
jgi:hypothetical protein